MGNAMEKMLGKPKETISDSQLTPLLPVKRTLFVPHFRNFRGTFGNKMPTVDLASDRDMNELALLACIKHQLGASWKSGTPLGGQSEFASRLKMHPLVLVHTMHSEQEFTGTAFSGVFVDALFACIYYALALKNYAAGRDCFIESFNTPAVDTPEHTILAPDRMILSKSRKCFLRAIVFSERCLEHLALLREDVRRSVQWLICKEDVQLIHNMALFGAHDCNFFIIDSDLYSYLHLAAAYATPIKATSAIAADQESFRKHLYTRLAAWRIEQYNAGRTAGPLHSMPIEHATLCITEYIYNTMPTQEQSVIGLGVLTQLRDVLTKPEEAIFTNMMNMVADTREDIDRKMVSISFYAGTASPET